MTAPKQPARPPLPHTDASKVTNHVAPAEYTSPPESNPKTPLPEPSTKPKHSRPEPPIFAHKQIADFLRHAQTTGRLGNAKPDCSHSLATSSIFNILRVVVATIPYSIICFQFFWSAIIVALAYHLRNKDAESSWTIEFWSSRLNVTSSVSYYVGWALFILLGFFIRESSTRFRDSQVLLFDIDVRLRQVIRSLRQAYPPNSWHPGDLDRIAAHLVAYPIALKMHLRDERDASQLRPILHSADLTDVINADLMHIHCSRVVRAYFAAAEDDAPYAFRHSKNDSTVPGWGIRYLVIDLVDTLDFLANSVMRISDFRPAFGYINHMNIFLYVWMMFLPLTIVQSSGW